MTKNNKQKSWVKKAVVGTFVSVPFISSIISTIHLINLFDLGNATPMSIALAIAFELGSVAAFLVPAVLPSIKKGLVYTIFIILAAMQIIGNVFSSYDFIFEKVKAVPSWLDSFMAFISNFGTFGVPEVTLYLSLLIGLPIPLIALFFLKSWMDYLHIEDDVEKVEVPPKIEKQEDPPQPIRIMSDTQVPGSGIVDESKDSAVVEDFTNKFEENLVDIDPKYTDEINENFWELLNEDQGEKTIAEEVLELTEPEVSEIEPDSEVAILQNNNLR